ncbi:glutathione S-transferase theta-2 isoform X2 [Sphaeramia orbicularis]|uniref:glutathione S-transferase theta-2 isoform X2 n=1 Tax=Sphaeramia orbicularis TaxID=375764 RepID=UPI00117D754C|nr:glutathione S-transferase theta-1-like isoform X2 [Sphaeramia orbicularis]
MSAGRVLEVYLDLLSQPCRAVHILLNCTRIPHRVRTVALRKGEQRTPEFTQLNPMQKVPVLVDDGFVLTESDAILKYLVTKYHAPQHWYPRQPERRARVDEYTAWHHSNTRPHAARVFILEVQVHTDTGPGPRPDRVPSGWGRPAAGCGPTGRHAGQTGVHVPAQTAFPLRRRRQPGRPAGTV